MCLVCLSVLVLALSGCSRRQQEWEKAREADTVAAYETFLKAFPGGEFVSQARARILPWALVGTGSAVIAAGIATGLIASSKEQELEDNCPQGNCPNPSTEPGWQEKIHDTKRIALVTDVLWGVGLATLGAGITLLVIDPAGDEPAQTELQAGCRGGGCGLALSGRF